MYEYYIVYGVIMLIPTLFALFIHNYICHGKLSAAKKILFFFVYNILINFLMLAIAWIRNIKGIGIAYMTTDRKSVV